MKRVRKRLLLTVCAMVLPLAVTLIIYNVYSMIALNRQAAQSAAGTGYIYEQFYEKSIKTVESYMILEMVENDFRRLNYPLESLQAYLCGQNILEDFTKYLTSDVDGLVALEFYSESNDLVRIKHATGTRYVPTKQSGICRAVYEEMKQGELNSDWYVIPVGDDYFLIRILKYGSMYIGAVMDFDQFMKPSSEVEGRSSYLVYATQDGQALNQKKLLEEKLHHAEYETRQSELEIQKVREADKLKSAFLANMSHEIRTPLNAIIGFSNILAETDDKEEKEEFVKIISKNSDLLLRLITDILDFSKIESGILDYSFTDTSLKDIFHEQYLVHALKMPEKVSLICDFDALPDILVHTDPKRVTQVISNLISNATKFTEEGSIRLFYRIVEGYVLIEVIDTGIGISPQHQQTIFDRFVKVNSFKQGTGLGLTICKTIIEALNGTIGVDSRPGEGARFWFTLPYNG